MIEVAEISKRYGETVAVDRVSFTAPRGAIFGLLGPNGAGKSTTIGCISGLVAPSAGRVSVLGHDVATDARAAKAALGIVPQELALYEDLSAAENLAFWGAAYAMPRRELDARVDELLALVGLADRRKEPVKKFSGGMKRRLNFACGIVHRPAVLLLDEPTVGVDPQSRVRLLDLVREEARRGTCVLYTTHYLEEAETLCDRLAILDHGRVIAQGTLPELRALLGERDLLRLNGSFDPKAAASALAPLGELEVVQATGDQLTLSMRDASKRLPSVFTALGAAGGEVRETTLTQPSLESLFIQLTGKELRE
ncbi:MAG TPA: ABC transporter ATP-binding protein [Planctomycetota bacterium]|jgi:ABC-2 type transport system ATP-binding protein|nr:ABC transporter ATP-binding protein [Planctomycetota bacterium]